MKKDRLTPSLNILHYILGSFLPILYSDGYLITDFLCINTLNKCPSQLTVNIKKMSLTYVSSEHTWILYIVYIILFAFIVSH